MPLRMLYIHGNYDNMAARYRTLMIRASTTCIQRGATSTTTQLAFQAETRQTTTPRAVHGAAEYDSSDRGRGQNMTQDEHHDQ